MKSKTFLFREGILSYSDTGKGRAVFLIHGFLESKEMWKYFVAMLSPYYRVIAIDLPGHGNSACYGYVHGIELLADCVHALMRHLGLRKVFLTGHSLGGYTALAFAEKYPDNVFGMCLLNSTAYADSEKKKKDRSRAIALAKKNSKSWIHTVIPNLFYTKHQKYPAAIKRYRNIAMKTPLRGILAAQEGMKIRKDRTIVLKFAPFPILIIAGMEDPFFTVKDMEDQFALVKAGKLMLLEDVGHMAMEESSDLCWTSIKRFVQDILTKKVNAD